MNEDKEYMELLKKVWDYRYSTPVDVDWTNPCMNVCMGDDSINDEQEDDEDDGLNGPLSYFLMWL